MHKKKPDQKLDLPLFIDGYRRHMFVDSLSEHKDPPNRFHYW